LETGLGKSLSEEILTVFAPTNDAFEAIGVETLASLSLEEVTFILQYHAVEGEVLSTDLVCESEVEMANGVVTETQCLEDGSIFQVGTGNTEDSRPLIVEVDIDACNGVVHVVDNVILPDPDIEYTRKLYYEKGSKGGGKRPSTSEKSSKSGKKSKKEKKLCPKPPGKSPEKLELLPIGKTHSSN
jgi:Fasciclin domain